MISQIQGALDHCGPLISNTLEKMGASISANPPSSAPDAFANQFAHNHQVSLCSTLARAAELYPNDVATIDGERKKTWRQVRERVAKIASKLVSDLGVQRGDRICLLGLNSDCYFEAMFAIAWAGAVVVPMNFRLSPPELNHVIHDSGAKILVVDATFRESLLPQLDVKALLHVLPLGIPSTNGFEDFAVAVDVKEIAMSERGGHDCYGIFYTGGTTGKAKGAMLSHVGLHGNAIGTLWLNSFHRETKFLHTAPMFHLADAQMVFAATLAGSVHVFSPRFAPPEFLPMLAKHSINKVVVIPVMLQMVLNQPKLMDDPVQKEAIDKINANNNFEILYGGSVLTEATLQQLRQVFPNVKLFAGFGMTEMSPGIAFLSNKDHNDPTLLHSIGQPMPWVEVRICGPDDVLVPRGQFGEIQARGLNMMLGYWNLPGVSAETLKGGWMHTGDAGKMDENGYLYLGDRIKDMVKSGGENVFSIEVEKVIALHPKIAMSVVVGVPDSTLGEKVVAVVVLKDKSQTLELQELKEFCNEKLASYKIPKGVFVKDALPMSGAGKILKHEIRKELGAIGAKNEVETRYQ